VVKALAAIFVFCDDELNVFFHFVCKFVPLFRCDIEQGFFLNRKQIYSVVREYRTTQKEKTLYLPLAHLNENNHFAMFGKTIHKNKIGRGTPEFTPAEIRQ